MGENNPMYGKPFFKGRKHTEQSKLNMRKPKSPEGKKNIQEAIAKQDRSGKNNGMYGKRGSDNPNSRPLLLHGKVYNSIKEKKYELLHQISFGKC